MLLHAKMTQKVYSHTGSITLMAVSTSCGMLSHKGSKRYNVGAVVEAAVLQSTLLQSAQSIN